MSRLRAQILRDLQLLGLPAEEVGRLSERVLKGRGNPVSDLIAAGVRPRDAVLAASLATGLPVVPDRLVRFVTVGNVPARRFTAVGAVPFDASSERPRVAFSNPDTAMRSADLGLPSLMPYLATPVAVAEAVSSLSFDDLGRGDLDEAADTLQMQRPPSRANRDDADENTAAGDEEEAAAEADGVFDEESIEDDRRQAPPSGDAVATERIVLDEDALMEIAEMDLPSVTADGTGSSPFSEPVSEDPTNSMPRGPVRPLPPPAKGRGETHPALALENDDDEEFTEETLGLDGEQRD
jgi:hypothetical protein